MRRISTLFVLALFGAQPVSAAAWLVPGLANITGRNGTHFSSDLKVLNQGASATVLTFELTLLSGAAPPAPATRPAGPGETVVLTNALRELWGLDEQAGTARVSADQPLLVAARTYNDADPAGTYGTALVAVPEPDLLVDGEIGYAPWVSESPDASLGYRTNVGVYLAVPGSSVDIVVFDAAGAEVGRANVSGGPRAFQTSVSSFVTGGLAVGRAEFWLRAGKATGYAAVVDNVTGDGIAVQTQRASTGTTNVVVNGVAHAPGREGTYFQTDVRLFNLGSAAVTVQVNALALGSVPQKTVSLAAGETKQIDDVLAALFGLPDGAAGALQFVALGNPVLVLARTSNVHKDGTPGTFGAFQTSATTFALPGPGSTSTLIGLRQSSAKPGYRTNVGFLGGPNTGGTARLVLRDRSGGTLANVDGAISLGAYGWVQKTLSDVFPGVSIPDDSSLDVVVTAGSLDVFASVIDNVTGDPVVSRAAIAIPYACNPPQVYSFQAEPASLAAAGPATLRWYSDADGVGISSAGSALPGSGTATVNAAATGTYILTARNGCGTTTASVTLVVGPPAAPVSSVPSGAPGQLLKLTPRNVPPGASVTGAVFRFPDGYATVAPRERVLADGTVVFVVPYPGDPSAAGGYRQGAATVALQIEQDTESASTPFRFDPLAAVADPVGRMRAWIDTITGASRSALANLATLEGGADALPVLNGALDTWSARLRKITDDIAATGSATLPVTEPVAGSTTPANGTLNMAQLSVLVAVLDNLSASSIALASSSGASRAPLASPPCLRDTDLPGREIKFCQGAIYAGNLFDPSGILSGNLNGLVATFDLASCVFPIASAGFLAAVDRIVNVIQLPSAICPLFPIWFKFFDATPNKVQAGLPNQIQLFANLGPLANQSQFISYLAQKAIDQLVERRLGGAPPACSAAVRNLVSQYVQDAAGFLQSLLNQVLQALRFPSLAPVRLPVGSCDLYDVLAGSSLLKKTQKGCESGEGVPYYCFEGQFPGGLSSLRVRTKTNHMLFGSVSNGYFSPDLRDSLEREPDRVPITVGAPPLAGISNVHTTVGPGDTIPFDIGPLLPGVKTEVELRGAAATLVRIRAVARSPRDIEVNLDVWGGPANNTYSAISYQLRASGFGNGSKSASWSLKVRGGGYADFSPPADYGYKISGSIQTPFAGTLTFGDTGAQRASANFIFDQTVPAGDSISLNHALDGYSQGQPDPPARNRFHFYNQLLLHFDDFGPP